MVLPIFFFFFLEWWWWCWWREGGGYVKKAQQKREKKTAFEWTRHVQIREEEIPGREPACWPTAGFKGRSFHSSGISTQGTSTSLLHCGKSTAKCCEVHVGNGNTKRRTQEQSGSLTVVKAQVKKKKSTATRATRKQRHSNHSNISDTELVLSVLWLIQCDPVCFTVTLFTSGESRAVLSPGTRHGISKYRDNKYTATMFYIVHATI